MHNFRLLTLLKAPPTKPYERSAALPGPGHKVSGVHHRWRGGGGGAGSVNLGHPAAAAAEAPLQLMRERER